MRVPREDVQHLPRCVSRIQTRPLEPNTHPHPAQRQERAEEDGVRAEEEEEHRRGDDPTDANNDGCRCDGNEFLDLV